MSYTSTSVGHDVEPMGTGPHSAYHVRSAGDIMPILEGRFGRQGIGWRDAGRLQVQRNGLWYVVQAVVLSNGTPTNVYFYEGKPWGLGVAEADRSTMLLYGLGALALAGLGAVLFLDKPARGWP